mmetsp:Transcript_2104/g.3717  ORF Transcript_2104/g.3717 Transcript_2104/m.3717 type:complete len:504 (-) Transcript_2104:82-1593(-)
MDSSRIRVNLDRIEKSVQRIFRDSRPRQILHYASLIFSALLVFFIILHIVIPIPPQNLLSLSPLNSNHHYLFNPSFSTLRFARLHPFSQTSSCCTLPRLSEHSTLQTTLTSAVFIETSNIEAAIMRNNLDQSNSNPPNAENPSTHFAISAKQFITNLADDLQKLDLDEIVLCLSCSSFSSSDHLQQKSSSLCDAKIMALWNDAFTRRSQFVLAKSGLTVSQCYSAALRMTSSKNLLLLDTSSNGWTGMPTPAWLRAALLHFEEDPKVMLTSGTLGILRSSTYATSTRLQSNEDMNAQWESGRRIITKSKEQRKIVSLKSNQRFVYEYFGEVCSCGFAWACGSNKLYSIGLRRDLLPTMYVDMVPLSGIVLVRGSIFASAGTTLWKDWKFSGDSDVNGMCLYKTRAEVIAGSILSDIVWSSEGRVTLLAWTGSVRDLASLGYSSWSSGFGKNESKLCAVDCTDYNQFGTKIENTLRNTEIQPATAFARHDAIMKLNRNLLKPRF